MKNVKLKILLPLGVSALSLTALSAHAQEPIDDQVRTQLEEIAQVAATEDADAVARAYADIVDAYARKETDRLDETNIVEEQSRIGEDILIIGRQTERAEAIDKLVEYLGSDAFRKLYPELAETLDKSPILLRADKNRADLELSLKAVEHEIENFGIPTEDEAEDEAPVAITEDGEINPVILEAIEKMISERDAAVEEKIAAAREEAANEVLEQLSAGRFMGDPNIDSGSGEDAYNHAQPVSLREIYGSGGKFTAVILQGSERTRIYEGDILNDGSEVEKITDNSVVIRNGEDLTTLKMRK
jgi:CHASE3 domain sensor protein